ncbi:hypothetical protein OROGR_024266 [Orobanche gracilis]
MSRAAAAAAYCRRVMATEQAHPLPIQIYAEHPLNCFLLSSRNSSSSSSSLHNYYIRKRRKWPIQPLKTQWDDAFAFRLVKQSFKQSIRKDKTHLLSNLINSFSAYEINPTSQSYHFLFKILIQNRPTNCHDQIRQILDHVERAESFETPESVFIDLIEFYGGIGMFNDAVELFCRIPRFRCDPSVEVLNALLSVLCRNRKGLEMVPQLLVKSAEVMKIRAEESSFGILIKALCKIGSVSYALELLNHVVDDGFGVDQRVCSFMLASMCRQQMKCNGGDIMGFMEDLKKLGFEPRKHDFCNVIRCFVRRGKSMDALGLLKRMKMNGVKPDIMCYSLVFDGLVRSREFSRADKLFDELLVLGLNPDIYTYSVYISLLCMQKKVDDGIRILHSMEELGCKPNSTTYSSIVRALCEAGEIDRAMEVVSEMRRKCMRLNAHTYGILIDGFVRNGDVNGACGFFKEMMAENSVPQHTALDKIVRCLCGGGLCSKVVELLGEEVVKKYNPENPTLRL